MDEVEKLTDSVGKKKDYTVEDMQKLTLIGNHKIPNATGCA